MLDLLQQMLGKLVDFNTIPYGIYRLSMKLRFIQKKTKFCHVTVEMWMRTVEEHCLENPNLVLQPAEISSIITSLLQEVSQEAGEYTINEDETARLILSFLSILYPHSTLTSLQLHLPVILLSNSDTLSKHRMLFEMARLSGKELSFQQLSHLLHLSSYLVMSCGENSLLGSTTSQNVAHCCYGYHGLSPHRGLTLEQYLKWVQSDPEYLAWVPTLYRLNVSQSMKHDAKCGVCGCYPILGLRYKCLQCSNLQLCQECFLSGKPYKSHDQSHPLKEYITKGSTSESIKDLTAVIKTYFKPKGEKGSNRYSSEGKGKSAMSQHESQCCETVATDDWIAEKGRLPGSGQAPLQWTSCPNLQPDSPVTSSPEYHYNTTRSEFHYHDRHSNGMQHPPPYQPPKSASPQYQGTEYGSSPQLLHNSSRLLSNRQRTFLYANPTQTLSEMADTFSTDLSLYSGEAGERQPVVNEAGNIGAAMDSFLLELFAKAPFFSAPPKPKRSSPNLSKASSGTLSDNTTAECVNLHLAFDPHAQNRVPAHLTSIPSDKSSVCDRSSRGNNTLVPPRHQGSGSYVCSSTPRMEKKHLKNTHLDVSFPCSSIHSDHSTNDRNSESRRNVETTARNVPADSMQARNVQHAPARNVEYVKRKIRSTDDSEMVSRGRSPVVPRGHPNAVQHSSTNADSEMSSITRSIRQTYRGPPAVLLHAVQSEAGTRSDVRSERSEVRSEVRSEARSEGADEDVSVHSSTFYRNYRGLHHSGLHGTSHVSLHL